MGDEPDSYSSGDVTAAASTGGLKSKVKDFLGGKSGSKSSGGGSPGSRYAAIPSSLKKGGKIKKTGYAKVHKGEKVLTKKQAKRQSKRGRKRG